MKSILFVCMIQFVCTVAVCQETPVTEPKSDKPFLVLDEEAEFPGGKSALMKFLSDNLKYPESAKELGIEGKCYVQFIVTKTGELTNIEVRKGIPGCAECDKEALRLVRLMPKWNPGKYNNNPMDSRYTLPIVFKLN